MLTHPVLMSLSAAICRSLRRFAGPHGFARGATLAQRSNRSSVREVTAFKDGHAYVVRAVEPEISEDRAGLRRVFEETSTRSARWTEPIMEVNQPMVRVRRPVDQSVTLMTAPTAHFGSFSKNSSTAGSCSVES